jgi:prephenate dehydratase
MPVLGKRHEYNFYVDIEWEDAKQYDTAIRKILKYTQNFNILGEYQKHEEEGNGEAKQVKEKEKEKAPRRYIDVRTVRKSESPESPKDGAK